MPSVVVIMEEGMTTRVGMILFPFPFLGGFFFLLPLLSFVTPFNPCWLAG